MPTCADVKEVFDGKALGKLPGLVAQLRGFDVLAGGGVVQHDSDLVPVKDTGKARLDQRR